MNSSPVRPFLLVRPPQAILDPRMALFDRDAMRLLRKSTELVVFADGHVRIVQDELQRVLDLYRQREQVFSWSWMMQEAVQFSPNDTLLEVTLKLFHHSAKTAVPQPLIDCSLWLLAIHRCLSANAFLQLVEQLFTEFVVAEDPLSTQRKEILQDHCRYLIYCAPFSSYEYLGDYTARAQLINAAVGRLQRLSKLLSPLTAQDSDGENDNSSDVVELRHKVRKLAA